MALWISDSFILNSGLTSRSPILQFLHRGGFSSHLTFRLRHEKHPFRLRVGLETAVDVEGDGASGMNPSNVRGLVSIAGRLRLS
jgi:hypothetical protein